jgi:hypothetical protein
MSDKLMEYGGRLRSPRLFAVSVLLVWAAFAPACAKEDTGECCTVLPGRNEMLIPQPETGPDGPRSIVRIDPAFDCDDLTCVSYKGSAAFCTKECAFDDGCPEGFTCEAVIMSDPGGSSNIGPNTKFCVRGPTECLKE